MKSNLPKFHIYGLIKRNVLLIPFLSLQLTLGFSQPTIEWENVYGGTGGEKPTAMIKTVDGSFVIVGYTDSDDLDVIGQHGYKDIWVLKLDLNGNILWQNPIGGSGFDEGYDIVESSDGGYIIIGRAGSEDGDSSCDFETSPDWSWIVKLDINGTIMWDRCIEGVSDGVIEDPEIYSICEGINGGFAITGSDYYHDDSGKDLWVLKINEEGTKEWEYFYGGLEWEEGYSISTTIDGGYVICGYTESNEGDITTGENNGDKDFWILKLDFNGNLQWQKNYGSPTEDEALNVLQTSDGNFLVVGTTNGNGGDISGTHGQKDIWTIKLDSNGDLIWQKPYGGLREEKAKRILELDNGNFLICGSTKSKSGSGQVTFNHKEDKDDIWLVEIDSDGAINNDLSYGSSQWEAEPICVLLSNNEILISGYTGLGTSNPDGDISEVYDSYDIWVLKLNNITTSSIYFSDSHQNNIELFPNPSNRIVTISFSNFKRSFIDPHLSIGIFNSTGLKIGAINNIELDYNKDQIKINTSDYAPGIYFISFFSGDTVCTKSFIKI